MNAIDPEHYKKHPSGIECIQVAQHMSFNLGNVLKYIWRADLKGDCLEDLNKAKKYLEFEIEKRAKEKFERELTINEGPIAVTRPVVCCGNCESFKTTVGDSGCCRNKLHPDNQNSGWCCVVSNSHRCELFQLRKDILTNAETQLNPSP